MNGRAYFTVEDKVKRIDSVNAHGTVFRNLVLSSGAYLHGTKSFDKAEEIHEGDVILATCFVDIPVTREGKAYVVCLSAVVMGRERRKKNEEAKP